MASDSVLKYCGQITKCLDFGRHLESKQFVQAGLVSNIYILNLASFRVVSIGLFFSPIVWFRTMEYIG